MYFRLFGVIFACCVLAVVLLSYLRSLDHAAPAGDQTVRTHYEPWDASSKPGIAPTGTSGNPAVEEILPVLWHTPGFSYVDQNGKTVTDRDLLGTVWIGDFIFTQCTTACPVLTAKMVIVQRQLTDENAKFVSFSVDPDHDTPDVLKKYADQWNGSESRWHLLSTTTEGIAATAAGMKVTVQKTDEADNPILHSNLFSLVDQNGDVRGIYNSIDPETLQRLIKHGRQLLGNPPTESAGKPEITGAGLYMAMGCAACHTNPKLAPPLGGLPGSTVTLNNSTTITADDAYIKESILDAGAKIVAGYRRSMPTYAGYVGEPQADKLVEYIKTLKVPTTVPTTVRTTAPATVVDLVCGMDVDAVPDTLHIDHDGKTYYFCSETCRDRFIKQPAKYVK